MAEIRRISSNTPWEPVFGYSRAVRAGNLVAISGTTATDANGNLVGINQMYVQARQAIDNVRKALDRVGAGLKDVIRTRVFVTDLSRFEEVARAHRETFGESPPATSAVEVRRLVHPDMMIEIEADALIPDATGGAKASVVVARAKAKAPTARVKAPTKARRITRKPARGKPRRRK